MPSPREPDGPRVDVAAQIGTYLFLAGAAITALALVLPHSPGLDTTGYWALCAFMLVLAVAIWLRRGAEAVGTIPWVIVVASIAVVTLSVYFNGERAGGPAMVNELYYVWPALYIGYFFGPRAIAFVVALIGVAYAWTLHAIHLGSQVGITRWIITVSVAAGSAFALHAIRRYVNALVARLSLLVRTDPLTGVLNRRGFDERLTLERRRARRSGEPLSLLVGDIDHFKRLNDELGHAAGDEALQAVAKTMSTTAREVDAVARLGGEEFAVLMPNADVAGAFEAAERMRAAITSADGRTLTMSFGAVELGDDSEQSGALIERADRALYEAKAAGRNRTVIARVA